MRPTKLTARPMLKLQADTRLGVPLIPLLIVCAFRGGIWKSTLAVAIAERLAWAGLKILLVVTDRQQDARFRLGLTGSKTTVIYGPGSITALMAQGEGAADYLFRGGEGLGAFDLAIMDTPPNDVAIPGTFLVCPVDDEDSMRNLVKMLATLPAKAATKVLAVKIRGGVEAEWQHDAGVIQATVKRDVEFLPEPLPEVPAVRTAHREHKSVWTLPRSGDSLKFLEGVETMAYMIWEHAFPDRAWPELRSLAQPVIYVPGLDGARS